MAPNKSIKATAEQIAGVVAKFHQTDTTKWTKTGDPSIPAITAELGLAPTAITRVQVQEATARVQSSPPENKPPETQDDKPAETPAENGDGDTDAEPTAGQKADKMIADARIEANKIIKKANEDADKIRSGAETEAANTAQKADTPAEPVILEDRVLVKCVADSCGVNGNGENPDIDTLKRDDIAWITESIAEALGIDGSNQLMVIADPSDQVLERARNKKDLISA